MNKDNMFELYTLIELSYEKHFKSLVDEYESLYPIDWYKIRSYKEKIEILSESLSKNILIKDTEKYKDTKSCIKYLRKD